MTEWHWRWQEEVPEYCREFTIGPHRADILAIPGFVVELQHSSISPEEIAERERFYQKMVWVFDAREAYGDGARERSQENNNRVDTATKQLLLKHGGEPCDSCPAGYSLTLSFADPAREKAWRIQACIDSELSRNNLRHWWPDPRLFFNKDKGGGKGNYRTFRWMHPRKTIATCTKPVLLDLGGDGLLFLGRMYPDAPCGGWGLLTSRAEFVAAINGQNPALAMKLIGAMPQ